MRTLEEVPPTEQEVLFRFLAMRLGAKSPPLDRPYRTRTHRGKVRQGINADKLGQLAEDL